MSLTSRRLVESVGSVKKVVSIQFTCLGYPYRIRGNLIEAYESMTEEDAENDLH